MWMALAAVLAPPGALFVMGFAACVEAGIMRNAEESEVMVVMLIAGWVLAISHISLVSISSRKNLITRFREIASDRQMAFHRFAWRTVRRFALRFATAVAVAALLFVTARIVIDRRGEKIWAQTRAQLAHFPLETEDTMGPDIPEDQNLARADIFKNTVAVRGGQ